MMEIDDIINSPNWRAVASILSVIAAGVAILPKLSSFLSDYRNKSRLKRDLELLKLSEETDINTNLIRKRIEAQLSELYKERKRFAMPSFPNILGTVAFSGGFAFWTYHIYTTNHDFNPWMILTTLLSIIGLIIVFDPRKSKASDVKKRTPIFALYVFSWWNAIINFTVAICSIWYSVNLFLGEGLSGWHILMAVLIGGCIYGVGKQFAIRTKKDFTEDDEL